MIRVLESIQLLPLALTSGEGAPRVELIDRLAAEAARVLAVSCQVETAPLSVDYAFETLRCQVWSTPVLARLQERARRRGQIMLGLTMLDLYVPILTFVFGEAQLNGPAAVVSAHRLREEYYGMEASDDALVARLLKETLHELGHTQGLKHCTDWRCVMSSAHTVERIDIRQAGFCGPCARIFAARVA